MEKIWRFLHEVETSRGFLLREIVESGTGLLPWCSMAFIHLRPWLSEFYNLLVSPDFIMVHCHAAQLVQALYAFPPEIETSALPLSLEEKLDKEEKFIISIWQLSPSCEKQKYTVAVNHKDTPLHVIRYVLRYVVV